MNIKIGKARVSDVTRTNPITKKDFKVTQVCVTIENTGSAKETLEIDIKARARKYGSTRKVFEVVCRKKKVTVGPRIDLGQVSANGYLLVCCDVPNAVAATVFNFGGDYIVAVGRKRGTDGDVSDIITTKPIALPTRVSMESGSRLRYSDVVGTGFEDAAGFTFEVAADLPTGWRFEFPDPMPMHDNPGFVPFNIEARPGAIEGETATLVLRTFMPGPEDSPLLIEEGNFQFTVGKTPDCCACGCDTTDSDAAGDAGMG